MLLTFVFCWSAGIQAYAQAQFSGVSEQCAVRWNLYLRDVCSTYLLQNPVQFGGRNVVVHIGFYFGHDTLVYTCI